MPIFTLIEKLEKFDYELEGEKALRREEYYIEDILREQIKSGKYKDGKYISPKYSEDSYFKDSESAYRYAKWKADRSSHKDKPMDVPDLFIDGSGFINYLYVFVRNKSVYYQGAGSLTAKIERKYGADKLYGYTDESKVKINSRVVPIITQEFKKASGL